MRAYLKSALLAVSLAGAAAVVSLPEVGVAYAAEVDFTGTWALDKDASSSVDAMLKAQGVSFVERKVAAGMDVTQVIAQTGDALTIEVQTSKKNQTQAIAVDGVARQVATEQGPAMVSHRWDGAALVTVSDGVDKAGAATRTTITRTLSADGQTLQQKIAFTAADGVVYDIDRVFRKQ